MNRRYFFNLLPALSTLGIISNVGAASDSRHLYRIDPVPCANLPDKLTADPQTRDISTTPDETWLRHWLEDTIIPIFSSDSPKEATILIALHQYTTLPIIYHRGSTPGEARLISPILLFTKASYRDTYLLAWCHTRNAPRHFNLQGLEIKIA